MEEGCRLRPQKKNRSVLQQKNQNIKIEDALMYPIYIVTSTYNSPHLKKLINLLQNKKITVSFQNSVQSLQMITNTYQKRIFIVFNDFSQRPSIENQCWQNRCECADYPQCQDHKILQLYRKFICCEKKKERMLEQRLFQKTANQDGDRIQEDSIKQEDQLIDDSGKPKIKLRSASKILHNYKTVWPKKLFIYQNRNDDKIYRDYICLIKNMHFDNACFINQIEDYVRFIPEKEDVCYCVLMSEYSALNLRKFFKRSDQILLFGQNDEQCLPLLRGKVTYYTNQLDCINKVLAKNFGMKKKEQLKQKQKQKSQPCLKKQISVRIQVGQYQSQIQKSQCSKKPEQIEVVESIITRTKQEVQVIVGEMCEPNVAKQLESSSKYEGVETYSSFNFKISPQFSLLNEPIKSQFLQSNTICFSYVPQKINRLDFGKEVDLNIQAINPDNKQSLPTSNTSMKKLQNDKEDSILKQISTYEIQQELFTLSKDEQISQGRQTQIEKKEEPNIKKHNSYKFGQNNSRVKQLNIKNNILDDKVQKQKVVSSELQMQSIKDNFFNSQIMKISPLKIVQIDIGSLANLSVHTSDIVQEKQTFQELLDKMNVDEVQSKRQFFNKKKIKTEKKMNKLSSNLSNQKQNDISSDRESQGSRFSNTSSRNSRILGRMNEVRKIKCRLPLESL